MPKTAKSTNTTSDTVKSAKNTKNEKAKTLNNSDDDEIEIIDDESITDVADNSTEAILTDESDDIADSIESKDSLEPSGTAESGDSKDSKNSIETDISLERDRYLRLAAEYDNFRKRSAKEREMIYTDARSDTIARLLPVYDNLERALKMECADEAFYKGVEMTMTGLMEIFEGMDIKMIPAVGEPFDPNRHNAVMTVDTPDFKSNIIAEEFQKGFIIGERVIRFSTVVVAN